MLIEYHNMFSQENNKKLNLVGNDICLISPSYSFQALYVDVRTLSHLCFSMFFYSVPMLEIHWAVQSFLSLVWNPRPFCHCQKYNLRRTMIITYSRFIKMYTMPLQQMFYIVVYIIPLFLASGPVLTP